MDNPETLATLDTHENGTQTKNTTQTTQKIKRAKRSRQKRVVNPGVDWKISLTGFNSATLYNPRQELHCYLYMS